MSDPVQVIITPPSPQSPGFLRRQRQALDIARREKDGDPTAIDEFVAFILPLVVSPANRQEAEAALWDLSQEQFREALEGVAGNGPRPATNDANTGAG